MKSLTAISLLASASPLLAQTTRHVPGGYASIQDAIEASSNGDTVLVAPGTYFEVLDFIGIEVVVRSTDGRDATTIDAQGLDTVVRFVHEEGPGARLEGFTVRNGVASVPSEAGGIHCYQSSPTIVDCRVVSNRGGDVTSSFPGDSRGGAGGVEGDRSAPTIIACVIEGNTGGSSYRDAGAGGIDINRGLGFGLTGPPAVVRDCEVRGNEGGPVTGGLGYKGGAGGIALTNTLAVIEDCLVTENVGAAAMTNVDGAGTGGLDVFRSLVRVEGSRFLLNAGGLNPGPDGTEEGGDGGVRFFFPDPVHPTEPSEMTNCVIAWNQGGDSWEDGGNGGMALYQLAFVHVTNCTIVGNVAGASGDPNNGHSVGGVSFDDMHPDPALRTTMTNTLLWANVGTGGSADNQETVGGEGPILSNNLNQGGVLQDPRFVDFAGGDLHLSCDSPAIDMGTDTGPVLPDTDIDGDPRPSGPQLDIGADEFIPEVFPTYCVANPNSSGNAAQIGASGCHSIAANDLTLSVAGLPDTPGLFFYGPNQIQVSFGDGVRCVGGAVRRTPPRPGMGASFEEQLDLTSLVIAPGVTSNFQYWFRDPMAGGAGFNLSDAVEVGFEP